MQLCVSVIVTVFNEEQTIQSLLEALLLQTCLPDEVIISDGGSTDRTLQLIQEFAQNHPQLGIQSFQVKGNRSVGRNAAIRAAHSDVIAITDAGCIPHTDWVAELVAVAKMHTAEKEYIIAGYYDAKPATPFEEAVVPYVFVMPDRVDPKTFLPATRSMAFPKSLWEKYGGFDEQLSDNEDYAFARKMADLNVPIYFTEKAKVLWLPRTTLPEFKVMIFRFARGDARAGIFRKKVGLIYARYILGLLVTLILLYFSVWLALLFILLSVVGYSFWAVQKNARYVSAAAKKWLIVLQFCSDLAVMTGTLAGRV